MSLKDIEKNTATVYGSISAKAVANNNPSDENEFLVTLYHNQFIDIHHPAQNVQVKFLAPLLSFAAGHTKSVNKFSDLLIYLTGYRQFLLRSPGGGAFTT